MKPNIITLFFVTFGLWLATEARVYAATDNPQGFDELSMDEVKAGSLLLATGTAGKYLQVPAVDTQINIEVSGMLAQHEIRQTFSNPSDEWLEAVYVYPLPDTATVDELIMTIGEKRIVGEIQTRTDARKFYQAAKDNGQQASLVERQRPNLFTTRVANIPPQAEIQIDIGFQADTRYDDGVFGLSLPLTITPRYIPGNQLQQQPAARGSSATLVTSGGWGVLPGLSTDQVPDAFEVTPPITDVVPNARLNIVLNSGLPLDKIVSPSHNIRVVQEDLGWRVLFPTATLPMDRDFILQWSPLPGNSPLAAVFTQSAQADRVTAAVDRQIDAAVDLQTDAADPRGGQAGKKQQPAASYASLMLIPPQQLFADVLPSREVIFVIDKSGSMDGTSLRAAKDALILGIRGLSESDTFNVVSFNNDASVMYARPIPASAAGKAKAVASVRRISAGGGTEIMGALNAAIATTSNSERVRQIIFMTDGSVGNEAAVFKRVRHKLGNNRIFTVGIGSAPNRWFMRKTAELGRGTYTYIADSSVVSEKMQALFHKLERPVLGNVQVQFSGVDRPEYYPSTVPDLYAGEPVLLDMRSQGSLADAELLITGDENGVPWRRTLKLDSSAANNQTGLDKLWARRKITSLENSLLFTDDVGGVKAKATQTALQYGLVGSYTSLVAVDQEIARDVAVEALSTKEVPLARPAGSNPARQSSPSVSIPQATPGGSPMPIPEGNLGIVLHLLISLVLSASVAVGGWFTRKRKHVSV